MLTIGDPLPWFAAPSSVNEDYHFDQLAGHCVVVVFLGSLGLAPAVALWTGLARSARELGKRHIQIVGVSQDPADPARYAQMAPNGLPTMFWDGDLRVARAFDIVHANPNVSGRYSLRPCVYLMDRGLLLAAMLDLSEIDWNPDLLLARIDEIWPPRAPVPTSGFAPALVVPRVIDRAMCRRLIDAWQIDNGESGFMRSGKDGKRIGILDDARKRRRDHFLARDNPIREELKLLIQRRIIPQVQRVFHYRITRVERYCVACYDGADRGFFGAHRDFVGSTSHRAFAMTLNLNSEEYTGGELCFPEYGPRLYRPGTGEAIVFSGCLLHEARPVTSGRRFALLSFFYSEREARVREEYHRQHGDKHETVDLRINRQAPESAPETA